MENSNLGSDYGEILLACQGPMQLDFSRNWVAIDS